MNSVETIISNAVTYVQPWLSDASVIFLRVGSAIGFMPAFGDDAVSVRVRLSLSIVITMVLTASLPPLNANLFQSLFPEILKGVFLGLMVRLLVMGLITAASIVASSASLSQVFPNGAEPLPAVGNLFILGGAALALQAGLHLRTVEYFQISYDLFPVSEWPSSQTLAGLITNQGARALTLALSLSMPFVISSLLYNLALGAMNKAMPQLMIALIGSPALALGGLILLVLASPVILHIWVDQALSLLADPAPAFSSLLK